METFVLAYDLYQTALFRYCVWKCRDREVARDLTQETFLRFWLCLRRKEPILHVRGFLYRIAHNLIIDHVRRKKESSLDQLLETGFEPTIDLWHHTYSRLDAERPLKTLGAMEEPYRQVLQQRFLLGLAPAEIATMTGETSNAVSVRIFRGLKHLRGLLQGPSDSDQDALHVRRTRPRGGILHIKATVPPLQSLARVSRRSRC